MYDHTLTDGPKDAPKVEVIEKDGTEVAIVHSDPYGLLHLECSKELPSEFKGQYTNLELARIDAHRYLQSIPKVKK